MSEALTKIGSLIKNKRTELGLSVKDLSEKSRVGYSNIVNIEEGIRDELPEDACLNGFLKILLKTLKLDNCDRLLIDYNLARESQEFINLSNSGRHIKKFPENNNLQNKLDSKKLVYLLVAFVFFVTVSNSFLQNASRVKQEKSDATAIQEKALNKQIKKKLKKTEKEVITENKVELDAKKEELLNSTNTGLRKLSVKVTDAAWLQIISAETGKVIFEGDVKPNSSNLEFSDKQGFVLSSGNAGALELKTDNGESLTIGKKDELVKWYYPDSTKEAYLRSRTEKKE
ncbi:MAG: helix-turn-helix domain-containing protein [Vampirovibrionia bacterium]|jgi:cytoskeletal protein RodZ